MMRRNRLTKQWVSHVSSSIIKLFDNLDNPKFRSKYIVLKKLIAGSAALKDLISLVVASILAVSFSIFSGGLGVIREWEWKNNLFNLYVEEILIVLIILGIATTIFLIRRYQELHEEIREDPEIMKGSSSRQKQAALENKNLKNLFYQVESAKKEWEQSLDSIEEMIILSDLDGTIHRCNRAFMDFVDLPYEKIRGENLASLLSNFGVELKDLDLKDLNARLNVMGNWFLVKSYPCKDFETGNITKAVIIMHVVSTNMRSAKVQFVWGRAEYYRPDKNHAIQ